MDIVSSHSWSRSNQTRRRSTSLSLKKPKQRRVGENAKEEIGKKSERKQSKNRGEKELCEISQPRRNSLRKRLFVAKSIRNTFLSSAKVFAAANPRMAHECHFAAQEPPFSQLRSGLRTTKAAIPQNSNFNFRSCEVSCESDFLLRNAQFAAKAVFFYKTQDDRSYSVILYKYPSFELRKHFRKGEKVAAVVRSSPLHSSTPLASPFTPSNHRRRLNIISSWQSPVPSPEPSPVPSPAPPAKPQASHPPPSEPQIPSGPAPEEILRRPMLTQPPIEGNLDCRTRPFHSELFLRQPPSNCD
ncbi:hypothetical protein CK203_110330 [Vitis vinifera]|uniref:Uncharacterized protein n=1 Tax=Vitis vinifera TaxID=29760 RepID=A0A438CVS8_VITVI|nr:hypothetical protein CK203_110330 [Vitis vinifera]